MCNFWLFIDLMHAVVSLPDATSYDKYFINNLTMDHNLLLMCFCRLVVESC